MLDIEQSKLKWEWKKVIQKHTNKDKIDLKTHRKDKQLKSHRDRTKTHTRVQQKGRHSLRRAKGVGGKSRAPLRREPGPRCQWLFLFHQEERFKLFAKGHDPWAPLWTPPLHDYQTIY